MPKGVPAAGFRRSKKRNTVLKNKRITIAPVVINETDAEVSERISDRFEALTLMTKAAKSGYIKSMIVSGPPGLGKSYEVEMTLGQIDPARYSHSVVKGHVTPSALYGLLYANRSKGQVLVFDDCDSVLDNELSLNLLKAACDSNDRRTLSWHSSREIFGEGDALPDTFDFEGAIIFISNIDFDYNIERGNKLAPHFAAMISRSHYLDLGLKSNRDYIVRIKQVVANGMLLKMQLTNGAANEIVGFIEDNQDTLREISCRMVGKIANLYKMDNRNWKKTAKITCLR